MFHFFYYDRFDIGRLLELLLVVIVNKFLYFGVCREKLAVSIGHQPMISKWGHASKVRNQISLMFGFYIRSDHLNREFISLV